GYRRLQRHHDGVFNPTANVPWSSADNKYSILGFPNMLYAGLEPQCGKII
ncbi:Hypothetical protein FKW44_005770, partial [Caligus rogercresseyi]